MFFISHIWLENAYLRPKIGVFGGFDRLNEEHYQRDPKRHILGQKYVIWRIDRLNRSTVATCALDEETKKERKTKTETQQWQTGYSPRPPTSSDWNEILRGGWSSDGSSKIQISSKSVKQFRGCGGVEICPSPLTWPLAYTTACTTVQAVIGGNTNPSTSKVASKWRTTLTKCWIRDISACSSSAVTAS